MDYMKLLDMIDDFDMTEEEYQSKYGQTEDWLNKTGHGNVIDWTEDDAYHRPCPIYEDGYIDWAYGYMGD